MKPRKLATLALPLMIVGLIATPASAQQQTRRNVSDAATVPGAATPAEQDTGIALVTH